MKLVVVSPHRDDAAFSLGLALETWIRDGHTVTVLNCFTQSSYAPYSDVEAVHANDRTSFVSALRKREDQAWNKLLGDRLRFYDLDLLDAPLRLNCSTEEVLTVAIRPGDRALARVQGAIAKLVGHATQERTWVVAPLAMGGHIDHRIVHQAALQALAAEDAPLALYEDLPYAAREGEADRLPALAAGTGRALSAAFASAPSEDPEAAIARKWRFAECYDSQIDSEVVGSIANFSRRYDGRERLWAGLAWQEASLLRLEEAQG